MSNPFFTVGHSTRSVDDFLELIKPRRVDVVIDVRTVPRSRTNPQFNSGEFAQVLAQNQVGYEHIAGLGGLRGKNREVDPDVNALWRNQSFHNYADYALGGDFQSALEHLRQLGRTRTCAIMCAEAVWWRCHRRIVADHLIARGEAVFHIMGSDRVEPAHVTEGAHVEPNGLVTYPAP